QILDGRDAVVDVEALRLGVAAGDGDVALAGVDAGDAGAEAGERLRHETAAAADVEHREVLQGTQAARGAAEMALKLVAGEGETHGANLVRRAELARRVPPGLGEALEALDLGRVEVARLGVGTVGRMAVG